jgi:vancomycin resistance protein YoaR
MLFAGGLLGLGKAYESWCDGRVYPGVRVWDVPVGGLTPDRAAARLEERLGGGATLALRGPDRTWSATFSGLGISLVPRATAEAALAVGRTPQAGVWEHLDLLLAGHNLPPVLSFDESAARLYLETLAEEIDSAPQEASLVWEESRPVAQAAQTGRVLDVEASLEAVRAALGRPSSAGPVPLVVHELPPQVTDAEAAQVRLETLLSQPFMLVLANPQEGDPGPWALPSTELVPMLSVQPAGDRLQVALDEAQARAYLETLAAPLAIEPVNARFHFNEATGQLEPIAPGAAGRALDVEASLANFVAAVEAEQHVATLVLQTVSPPYPETITAEEAGIRELVAEGDSYFIGSPSGRDHNIRLATTRFDGLIIPPGGTFSFNEHLGQVTAEAGYNESYITAGEQLAIEVGGGICQVSTTAFRAALWGGYPIVERWAHNHRVGYYELRGYGPGFDATVYSPVVDFRFTNDRSAPLLIEAEIEEGAHRLIFRFYSTNDGRQVEVEGPTVMEETQPGPPIYQLDPALAPGTVIEWQSANPGLTAAVERSVYDGAGNLLFHDRFVSAYDARRAAYHYGPGYEPPETPAPGQ